MKKTIILAIAVVFIIILTVVITRSCSNKPTGNSTTPTTAYVESDQHRQSNSGLDASDVALGAVVGAVVGNMTSSNRQQPVTNVKNSQTKKPTVKSVSTQIKPVIEKPVKKVNLTKKSKSPVSSKSRSRK